jgi:hypothetical protein
MEAHKYFCVNLKVVFPARQYFGTPICIHGVAKSSDLSIQKRGAKRNVIVYSHQLKYGPAYMSTSNSSYRVADCLVYQMYSRTCVH